MIGENLSHYQIVDKIGAGGMGEVYRARDPRIGRDVAIKILPSTFATNTDRLARFEFEARAAGALNHPNILAIFDVGNERGVPFLVSELLEGESLRERINSGSMTQRKAIEYAAQIADGLAAAHSHDIVHRDLKPENIFITRAGHAKILDFGLAKLTESDPVSPVSTESPTAALTDANVVVGTPGYMSPEQLRGGAVDHRSDIFAFGVVLYEMLAEDGLLPAVPPLRSPPPSCATSRRRCPTATIRCLRPWTVWCASVWKRAPTNASSRRTIWLTCSGRCRTPARSQSPCRSLRRKGRGCARLRLRPVSPWRRSSVGPSRTSSRHPVSQKFGTSW